MGIYRENAGKNVASQGSVILGVNAYSAASNIFTNISGFVDREANNGLFMHDGTVITIVAAGDYAVSVNAAHYNASLTSQSSLLRVIKADLSKQYGIAKKTFSNGAQAYANQSFSFKAKFAAGDGLIIQTYNNSNVNGGLYVLAGAIVSIERIN